MKPERVWQCAGQPVSLSRPLLMGIVNVTPDSFSDGGDHAQTEAAVDFAFNLVRDGADILDIGGESTRPGADPVPPDVEQERVIPVIRALVGRSAARISVDTRNAATAACALAAGAVIVNDISAGLHDPGMVEVVRGTGAGWVLMHMQGTPSTMQENPHYDDVAAEVGAFLRQRFESVCSQGILPETILFDPGIGFGKTTEHNLALLRSLDTLTSLGRPVLIGASRKRLLGEITGRSVNARLAAGLAVVCWCIARGVSVFRVHDVAAAHDALRMTQALMGVNTAGEG